MFLLWTSDLRLDGGTLWKAQPMEAITAAPPALSEKMIVE